MPLSYAKVWPHYTTWPSVHEQFADLVGDRRVLLFDPVQERAGTTSVGHRLRQIDASVRDCNVLVLRTHDSLGHERAVRDRDLLQRLTSASTIVSLVGATLQGPRLETLLGTPLGETEPWLQLLRSMEIEAIIERTGALFRDPRVHYLLPSQDHADGFLRIGDALHDPTEVSRISDWIAVHIRQESILIGDNGSLLSLLLMTRSALQEERHLPCHLRTISEYPISVEFLEQLLDDVVTRYPGIPIIFVISVNSSGRLLGRIQGIAPHGTQIIIISDNHEHELPDGVVRLHTHSIRRFPIDSSGKCDVCSERPLVGIDSRTYERIPDLTFEPRPITAKAAREHRDFWEAVERSDAVHLHFDHVLGEAEARHHGIYLNIPALLGDEWFRGRVVGTLRSLPTPALVLVPDHPASQPVVDAIAEAFGRVETFVVKERTLVPLVQERIRAVPTGETILIADDALIQGTTIRGLRSAIYRAGQNADNSPRVRAFVCLARPDSSATFRSAARPLRDSEGEQLYSGYFIYLPSSGENNCPWCKEYSLLGRIASRVDGDLSVAAERRAFLERAEMRERLLWDTEELTGSERTKDSFFGHLRPKSAFAAATAAAHQLRLQLKEASVNNTVAVLDVPMVLASYFDSVLLAAMFRTLDRRELFFAEQQDHVCEALARFPTQQAYPGIVAEFAWAAANNKLPRLAVVKMLKALPSSRQRGFLLRLLENDS